VWNRSSRESYDFVVKRFHPQHRSVFSTVFIEIIIDRRSRIIYFFIKGAYGAAFSRALFVGKENSVIEAGFFAITKLNISGRDA
jgi:hypothetical protein